MKKRSAENYLFDFGEWEHFIHSVLPQWINNKSKDDGLIAANKIDELFIIPLSNFIQQQHEKVPNSNLVETGLSLVTYLDYDLASKFRNCQQVVVEQLETLNELVNKFLAVYGAGEYAKKSEINSRIASKDRTLKPTKAELETDRENFNLKHAKYHGWKKIAQNDRGISAKTLNKILDT